MALNGGKSTFPYPDFDVEMSKGIQEVTDTLQVPSTEDDVENQSRVQSRGPVLKSAKEIVELSS